MVPLFLAGKGAAALSVFKRHWGKIIAGLFVLVWVAITFGLYNSNLKLTMALGASDSAVSVCIAERANMDKTLERLKIQIAEIQAENTKYKESIAEATTEIEELNKSIEDRIIAIDEEVIPETCVDSMDWMLEKALAR